MKRLIYVFFLFISAVVTSCSTDANFAENVNIEIQIKQLGSGYAEANFIPDGDAWYYANIIELDHPEYNIPSKKNFMNLSLDEAYTEYIAWRHDMLENGVPHIADFASHALFYGTLDLYNTYLKPDTDYMLYCFVVNPQNNKPIGELHTSFIHTLPVSEQTGKVFFEYRVNGQWDYVYPMSKDGKVVDNIPWIGFTRDQSEIDASGAASPLEYFSDLYYKARASKKANVFYGIYAHNNDGIGDGTSSTYFIEGHTYYTALMVFDGDISAVYIYKFDWEGPSTDITFVPNR